MQQDVIQLLPPQSDARRSGAEKENTLTQELKKEIKDLKNQVQCLTLQQKDTAKLLQSKSAEGQWGVSGAMPPLEEIEDSENNNSNVEEENSDNDMQMANVMTIEPRTQRMSRLMHESRLMHKNRLRHENRLRHKNRLRHGTAEMRE